MMSRLLLCVLILLLPNVALAVDFAVVQQASRTTTGTQDFTSFDSGQMTVNYGTVNASGRKLIGLFISEAGSSFGPLKRRF